MALPPIPDTFYWSTESWGAALRCRPLEPIAERRLGITLLESALRLYGAMGADRDIARICRIMRQNGVPIPYPWRGGRPSHGQTLSSREREVALLAAAGKTNQEIATELFLSRRTVESHISSALRKLDLLSRKELRGLTTFPPEPGGSPDA